MCINTGASIIKNNTLGEDGIKFSRRWFLARDRVNMRMAKALV